MKSLTPFGRALRKYRVDHGETQLDVANALGVTVSFFSAMETGMKNVPAETLRKLITHFRLGPDEAKQLRELAEVSQKEVRINLRNASAAHREVAAGFARTFSELSDQQIDQLRRVLSMKGS